MAYSRTEKKKDLIKKCRYYNGEKELPKSLPQEYALMWDYESVWVKCELEQNEMLTMFKEGIKEFHLETKRGDDTPLTLKALLFNRYLHWGEYASIEEELKNFEVWYAEHYLQRETNEKRMLNSQKPIFGISRHRMGRDGKGVTTLVTFMGCPLHCKYCLNPQCHEDIYEEDGKTLRAGIQMLTPQQLYDIVKVDNIYFQATGGGVCFGGGEPTMNVDFICEFAKLCGGKWKITVETVLTCSLSDLKKMAPYVDGWIVDIKDMNLQNFKRYTGVPSHIEKGLVSLRSVASMDKITVKVPLIPDFNTPEDVEHSIFALHNLSFENIVETKYVKHITHITE